MRICLFVLATQLVFGSAFAMRKGAQGNSEGPAKRWSIRLGSPREDTPLEAPLPSPDRRRSGQSAIVILDAPEYEMRLDCVPQVGVKFCEDMMLLPAPHLLLSMGKEFVLAPSLQSQVAESNCPQQLADRFLTVIFNDDNLVIVHDGHQVFYIRSTDQKILARADLGQILEAAYNGHEIVIRSLVIDPVRKDLLTTSVHEFHLPLTPEESIRAVRGPQDVSMLVNNFRPLGKIVHAVKIGLDFYVLELRDADMVLRHINCQFGAVYSELNIPSFDPKMQHRYFIEVSETRRVDVVVRYPDTKRVSISLR